MMDNLFNILSLAFNFGSLFLISLSFFFVYARSNFKINLCDPSYLILVCCFCWLGLGPFARISIDFASDLDVLRSSFFLFLSIFTCCLGLLLTRGLSWLPIKTVTVSRTKVYSDVFFLAGVMLLIVGFSFFILYYWRLLDFSPSDGNFYSRVDRKAFLSSRRGSFPYTTVLYVGFNFLLASSLVTATIGRKKLIFTFVSIAPLFVFYFAEGERSGLLKYVISSICLFGLFRKGGDFVMSLRTLFVLLFAVCLLFFIGNIRSQVNHFLTLGDWAPISEFRLQSIAPKEFQAVNFSIHYSVWKYSHSYNDFLVGKTYIQSIGYLFPRSVYDLFEAEKEKNFADVAGAEVAQMLGRTRKLGFGMSPAAEAFANFGWLGFPMVFIGCLALGFGLPQLIFYTFPNAFGLLSVGTLLPGLVFFFRSSFASVFSFFVMNTAILVVFYFLSICLMRFKKRVFCER